MCFVAPHAVVTHDATNSAPDRVGITAHESFIGFQRQENPESNYVRAAAGHVEGARSIDGNLCACSGLRFSGAGA